ncbi:hypothetical protein GA0004736_3418 [Curtobacterium sp. 9128]|uniref:DUF7426 family protein n=1 Tax=Curtobacterium sp. 9128 TaxID=1793722 RepID=UPI0007D73639|nr:hypothetical protein [Curtobacterium sp. 9128]SBN64458.1 hypothetical protein GA0004736_3418 [Curtobacterium sp. 9128]
MAPFLDYYDLADPLILPIRGTAYQIPPATAEAVVRWRVYSALLERLRAGESVTISDEQMIDDEEFQRMFLGAALDQMRADEIHPGVIEHAATTALADTMHGRDAAEVVWNSIDPKASKLVPPPVPETDSTPSTNTAEATTTNSPARTSGTKPRRKSPQRAGQRTGAKSSNTST